MRPVRPRDAASLVLLRASGSRIEVLMGRRGSKARFMPGRYVFPGGAVAAEDGRKLPGESGQPIAPATTRMALSFARAALRETFEETGLILGAPSEPGLAAEGQVGELAAAYLRHAMCADLALLRFVGRAITPATSPVRFHARFFLGDARHLAGELRGNGELEDLRWLSAEPGGAEPLSDVTRFMLRQALAAWHGTGEAVFLYHYVRRRPRVTRLG
jgi:8-oxo-dGTP pyrophosphatase MutT (NUDIX family)